MEEIKEEWAKFIIGHALADIKTEEDIPRVIEDVKGTALGVNEEIFTFG